MLSLGALLAACGDGVFDGPEELLDALGSPVRINPQAYPALQQVGGRAVVVGAGGAPVLVETIGVRQYRAVSLVCPHRGTVVDATASGFTCANHGARFSSTGVWVGGQPTGDLSPVRVTVDPDGSLMVGGVVLPPVPPKLTVSQNVIGFSASVTGAPPAAQVLTIANGGDGTLSGISFTLQYGASQPTGWLTATLSSLSAPATLTLSVARGALAAGTYTATVRLSAPGTSNGTETIAVSLVVIDQNTPPALQLSSTTLALSGVVGTAVAAQTIQVLNSGSGTVGALTVTIAYGSGATGWLSTSSLSGTSTPSTLTVRPLTTALAAGTYTATISVAGAGVTTRTLTVTLTIVNAGLAVTLAAWPALGAVGGVASVGTLNFTPVGVARVGATSYVAFSLSCPHRGTTVQPQNGQSWRCPNHGATWDAAGSLAANTAFRTSNLSSLTVRYTPGDAVLYVT